MWFIIYVGYLFYKKLKKYMGIVLKYKRYLARVREYDRRWGL